MGGMYAVYNSQIKANVTQQAVVEMQQSLRTALYLMERDIRMAGYDPYDMPDKDDMGIVTADMGSVIFTMDILGGEADGRDNDGDGDTDGDDISLDLNGTDDDGDGFIDEPDEGDEARFGDGALDDAGEWIRYALTDDADGDGVCDGSACDLGRASGSGLIDLDDDDLVPAALNIQAINFVYLDEAGDPLPLPISTDPLVDPNTSDIRSVQITIVARSGPSEIVMDANKPDTRVYTNQQGDTILPAQNDNIRRTVLTSEVRCRNMGLNQDEDE
jgi:type IV pilus assembly protein PilW